MLGYDNLNAYYDPALKQARLDRLLTAIADASRLDAEMSRARFVEVDLGALAREALAGHVGEPVTFRWGGR